MTTLRKRYGGMYTEVKRIVDGEVKSTTCCCSAPGALPKECSIVSGNKAPCRCDCHRRHNYA